MDTQYRHYRRLALVARDEQELATYRPQAQAVADYCTRWGMRYEELPGSDSYLRRLLEVATILESVGDDFLLVPPGGQADTISVYSLKYHSISLSHDL